MILRLTRELGVNLSGVDIILRLKDQMEKMECDMAEIRHQLAISKNSSSVPPEKSLVTTRSIYEMIIFEEK